MYPKKKIEIEVKVDYGKSNLLQSSLLRAILGAGNR